MRPVATPKKIMAGLFILICTAIPMTALARSTPVTVQNFPEVQAVEDVNHLSKQPYRFYDTSYWEIESGRTTGLSIGVSTDFVPEGKVLIVQHISYKGRSQGFLAAPTIELDIIREDRGIVFSHYLQPQRYQGSNGYLKYIGSQPITLVVTAGEKIQISMGARVDEDTHFAGQVSGYFVDAE